MNPELQALIELQDLDSRIVAARTAIARIPERIEREKAYLGEFEAAVDAAGRDIEAAKKRQRDAESQIQTLDQKLRDTRGKQALVKTNEEYRALSHEIEDLQAKISGNEDSVLEIMESIPALEAGVAEAKKELAAAQTKVQTAVKRHESERARLESDLELCLRERERAAKSVGSEWRQAYDKISHSRNPAVVPIVDRACQGCRMSETIQRFFEIRDAVDEIFTCTNCGRILYYKEAEAVSAAPRTDESE